MDINIEANGVVVGPNDRLVIAIKQSLQRSRLDELKQQLDDQFGAGKIFIINGDVELAVLKGDE